MAYFAPLSRLGLSTADPSNLDLEPAIELYLGLVHYSDGEAGARERIAAAQRIVPRFGIATECGLGRRPPETIPALLRLHAALAG